MQMLKQVVIVIIAAAAGVGTAVLVGSGGGSSITAGSIAVPAAKTDGALLKGVIAEVAYAPSGEYTSVTLRNNSGTATIDMRVKPNQQCAVAPVGLHGGDPVQYHLPLIKRSGPTSRVYSLCTSRESEAGSFFLRRQTAPSTS